VEFHLSLISATYLLFHLGIYWKVSAREGNLGILLY